MTYENLFNYMAREHGLNLLIEEMQEIEKMVDLDRQQEEIKSNEVTRIIPEFDSPKNWTQDRNLENGNYTNVCIRCKSAFMGHKRRVLCFECANKLD